MDGQARVWRGAVRRAARARGFPCQLPRERRLVAAHLPRPPSHSKLAQTM